MNTLDQARFPEGESAGDDARAILSTDVSGKQALEQLSARGDQMRGKLRRLLAAGRSPAVRGADITLLVEAVDDPDRFRTIWIEGFHKRVRGRVEEAVNEALRQVNGGSVLDAHLANYQSRRASGMESVEAIS
ncbi:MAG: hypothetical protein PHW10_04165 [Candidatus Peribacteraceae bacterium]|nr:hypothetical protein [Candidatus Peribacteraceae bacterium]